MDQRLAEAWETGAMVRPRAESPNFVDLVRAIAKRAGWREPVCSDSVNRIAELIGPAEHLVFVLVDAMGSRMLSPLPQDSFLRTHTAAELVAICPATTACAMTSIATGAWTSEHGMPEWWAYLDEFNLSTTGLRFIERFSETPLDKYGVRADDLWPLPTIMPGMAYDALCIKPAGIWDSTFSRYFRGGCAGAGYTSVPHAMDIISDRIRRAKRPTYTFLYLPQFDEACHDFGVGSHEAAESLRLIDRELSRLADGLGGRARLVISADHGQVNVPRENCVLLYEGDPLLQFLHAPPTGSFRVSIFHVKEGCQDAFTSMFEERFGRYIALLPSREIDDMHLFGPAPFSPLARRRFGDFVGFALGNAGFAYYRPGKDPDELPIGHHSGMTPDEMYIPLILA